MMDRDDVTAQLRRLAARTKDAGIPALATHKRFPAPNAF
jgi:hypothetical protein